MQYTMIEIMNKVLITLLFHKSSIFLFTANSLYLSLLAFSSYYWYCFSYDIVLASPLNSSSYLADFLLLTLVLSLVLLIDVINFSIPPYSYYFSMFIFPIIILIILLTPPSKILYYLVPFYLVVNFLRLFMSC